ncbi:uncharacterized protein K452DRAFT_283525 [Aplosporella prunicola CBS 121167]|uniref:Uncharacterized protein n=1 Tax=Aplosporella prunicola CBS 121167 TaxID=1176127 RepID=A0A6A6BQ44_9PEZI|nr:uncharacterized protein K452DRAFT_283525 [Aplosporella prunicola CBS 121167]KAF2146249.1 hypothetical protein K452DRAFT_283525 [Aplosporella prunicola CBS 121167]
MFSPEDIRELAQAFPNSSNPPLAQGETALRLAPSPGGDGFVNLSFVMKLLNDEIEMSLEPRLLISTLALQFGVDKNTIYELLDSNNTNVLLSKDRQHINPKPEATRLKESLIDVARSSVVYAVDFADTKDITLEGVRTLVSADESPTQRLALYPSAVTLADLQNAIIYSPTFLKYLVSDSREVLKKTQELGGPGVESVPRGSYPEQFLQLVLDELKPDLNGRFSIREGKIWFTAISHLEEQREKRLKDLVYGKIPKVGLQWFIELLPEQHPDVGSATKFIKKSYANDVLFFFDTVVSKKWYNDTVESKSKELNEKQFINVSEPFHDFSPEAAREAAAQAHSDVLGPTRQNEEQCTVAEGIFPYLIRYELFTKIQTSFAERVQQHAKYLWERTDQLPESELTLDIPSVLQEPAAQYELPAPFLQILLRCRMDGRAKSTFNATLAQLEAETNVQFAQFWQDRVVTRFELYNAGAAAIADAKLRAQLEDLLRDYVTKELVSDAISRAESRGLVRGARTPRALKKLQTALETDGKTVAAVQAFLQKFTSKLDIVPLDTATLAARKDANVADMARGMHKDSDGPRLFLTCVVVLLARKQEGVVYATGKFAPKLLKMLKAAGLEEDVGAKLERLKEAVKAGKVSDAERGEMRALASSGVEA